MGVSGLRRGEGKRDLGLPCRAASGRTTKEEEEEEEASWGPNRSISEKGMGVGYISDIFCS